MTTFNKSIEGEGGKVFDNILNFRDVGREINEFLGEKYHPFLSCRTSRAGHASIDVA